MSISRSHSLTKKNWGSGLFGMKSVLLVQEKRLSCLYPKRDSAHHVFASSELRPQVKQWHRALGMSIA